MADTNDNIEDCPVLSLIQQIKDGTLHPKTLSIEMRQSCVEVLIGESYTEAQVAQILQRSEKTISRDIRDIRQRNSLTSSPEFVKQFEGDALKKALALYDSLVRISRGKDVSNADKIQAVTSAWNILSDLIERFQSLGVLPQSSIVSDVFHHTAEDVDKDIVEIKATILQIEEVAKESGSYDDETQEQIKSLKAKVEQTELNSELKKLEDNIKKSQEEKGDKNE